MTTAPKPVADPGYFSQYDGRLDRKIEELLGPIQPGRPPYFLDIGAADGKTFSNTHRLALLGWRGTVVEPQPNCLIGLTALYADNPNIHVVNAALSPSEEFTPFYDDGGGMVATIDEDHRELWAGQAKFRRTYVAPVSWMKLLRAFPGPYDLVSIDVEGNNFSVFASMPVELVRPRLIVVEYSPVTVGEVPTGERDRMVAHAAGFGYRPVADIECNLFLVP